MDFLKRKNNILYIAIISYFILFILIACVLPKYVSLINAVFLVTLTISSFILYDFKRMELNELNKKVIKLVFASLIIYLSVLYLLGVFTGYGREIYSLSPLTVIKNLSLPLISVICLELFRYIFITNNKDYIKRIYFITFIVFIFDILLNFYIFDFTLDNIFIYITTIILPLIFKNIMLSYLSYKTGYYPCLLIVVTLCIYKYVIIFKPNLGNYLYSVVNIAYPALVYIYTSRMITNYNIHNKSKGIKLLIKVLLLDIPLILFFTIFIGLISGYFKYKLIGVEKSSIKTIKRGDAVLIYKYSNYKEYKKGDIIIYNNNNKNVIYEITKRNYDEYGVADLYITTEKTKGEKDKYKLIDPNNIIGKYVNFKISKIAIPTIKFKESIKKKN